MSTPPLNESAKELIVVTASAKTALDGFLEETLGPRHEELGPLTTALIGANAKCYLGPMTKELSDERKRLEQELDRALCTQQSGITSLGTRISLEIMRVVGAKAQTFTQNKDSRSRS